MFNVSESRNLGLPNLPAFRHLPCADKFLRGAWRWIFEEATVRPKSYRTGNGGIIFFARQSPWGGWGENQSTEACTVHTNLMKSFVSCASVSYVCACVCAYSFAISFFSSSLSASFLKNVAAEREKERRLGRLGETFWWIHNWRSKRVRRSAKIKQNTAVRIYFWTRNECLLRLGESGKFESPASSSFFRDSSLQKKLSVISGSRKTLVR